MMHVNMMRKSVETMVGRVRIQVSLVFCLILSLLAKSVAGADNRKLTISYNDQCTIPACKQPQNDSFANLVHITAKGTNDTIHYLWSSIGAPAVLVARTTQEAELVINWSDLLQNTKPGSISFKPTDGVLHSSALMFTRLIEYNDTMDDGRMKSHDERVSRRLDVLKWQNASLTINETDHSALFNSSVGSLGGNGTISLHLMAFGDDGRLTTLPHLQHTENSTQIDLTLQYMMSKYLNSRFALEMMVVGSGNNSGVVNLKTETTIDDEYTPAVFSTLELKMPDSPMGSYLQWKPVSYTLMNRAMENAKHVYEYDLETEIDQLHMPDTSIAHAYFSPETMSEVGALNISFGITKDGFYKKTNYSSWSASIGYGTPPEEFMTLTVYIVISVGLGIPLVIVVFGGAGVCISKHRQRKKRVLQIHESGPSFLSN